MMLVLLPVALLIIGAMLIVVLQRTRPNFGLAWLVALAISMVVWLLILAFYWMNPGVLIVPVWSSLLYPSADLAFDMPGGSWMYALSLVSLLLAVNVTVPVRMKQNVSPWLLIGNIVITSIGLLAILASNPVTLILAWTCVDLVELIMIIGVGGVGGVSLRAIATFAARVTGTFVIVWAMMVSRSMGTALTLGEMTPQMGLYLLLAVSLRLGIVPLQIQYSRMLPTRRGQSTLLRLVVPASSLVVLGRLPNLVMPMQWALFLSGFTALAALFGGGMWLTAKDEIKGRPFWILALAGMAVACVVRGQTAASLAWGIALLLSGGLLFLFTARDKRVIFLPLLGFLGLTGLPYSPAASGWRGLVVFPINILDIIFLLAHFMLLLGYLKHSLVAGDPIADKEAWIQVIYPVGLMILIITQWIIGLSSIDLALHMGVWWSSIITFILSVIGLLFFFQIRRMQIGQPFKQNWLIVLAKKATTPLATFFSLEWVYQIVWVVYRILSRLVNSVTSILEGDGGILWSLLLLALLISIIRTGVNP